ncbi:helix-turn-helix transcriptional regulator [Thalassobacillus sp. CUG 92003]|uniref:helix-turn-helix domain-containing protein n=1 Tax=Thalassobacillus sp. CUG 92003 TaxID=2736641 RepID=UPI002106CB9A|nr:helix-turn-helix transcriptional regulator [Thalassobacillus sp. CUG 92003]
MYRKGVNLSDLREELQISSKTTAKFKKKEPISLLVIGRICAYLNVSIEKVVNFEFHE